MKQGRSLRVEFTDPWGVGTGPGAVWVCGPDSVGAVWVCGWGEPLGASLGVISAFRRDLQVGRGLAGGQRCGRGSAAGRGQGRPSRLRVAPPQLLDLAAPGFSRRPPNHADASLPFLRNLSCPLKSTHARVPDSARPRPPSPPTPSTMSLMSP